MQGTENLTVGFGVSHWHTEKNHISMEPTCSINHSCRTVSPPPTWPGIRGW